MKVDQRNHPGIKDKVSSYRLCRKATLKIFLGLANLWTKGRKAPSFEPDDLLPPSMPRSGRADH